MQIWRPIRALIGFFLVALGMAAMSATGLIGASAAPDPATGVKEFRMANISALGPGINREDARLALEIIMRQTLVRETDPFRVKLDFIDDIALADRIVSQGNYHFVTLTGLDYLFLVKSVKLTPLMILSKLDLPTEALLLVTAKGQNLADLGRQPKRVLMLDQSRDGEMARIWLDTVLWEAGFESGLRFFYSGQRGE